MAKDFTRFWRNELCLLCVKNRERETRKASSFFFISSSILSHLNAFRY